VTIPIDPVKTWSWSVISCEPDTGIEMMAHIVLTSLCEDRLTATVTLPIAHLPIRDQENPVWQQRLAAVSDPEGTHFHTRDEFIGPVHAILVQPSAQHY
jgi:hypothetical protein